MSDEWCTDERAVKAVQDAYDWMVPEKVVKVVAVRPVGQFNEIEAKLDDGHVTYSFGAHAVAARKSMKP